MSIQSGPQTAGAGAAVALVATLISVYIVSQFLRNSIGVIAPNLALELGLSPVEIGLLSSVFFFVFAAVQIPVGVALDRFGPRLCLLVGAAVTVVGAAVFAAAENPGILILGRALLGLGTAGSLVASLAVYARRFPRDRFATLTGLQIGFGTLGALLATAPLAFSTATIGWRGSFLVRGRLHRSDRLADRARGPRQRPRARPARDPARELAGIVAVLRTPSVGRLFVMNLVIYSTFVLIVGLWAGPYLTHIYGYSLEARGSFLLIPVLAQIVGSMVWGPMDRLTGSHKLPVLVGAGATAAALGYLALVGTLTPFMLVAWFAIFGVGQRLRPGADRARQVAVPAPSGRQGTHGPQHGLDGRRIPVASGQRIRHRVVSGCRRRRLFAGRLSRRVRPAGNIHPIGFAGLFPSQRPHAKAARGASAFVPCIAAHPAMHNWVNIPYFSSCLLCVAVYIIAVR